MTEYYSTCTLDCPGTCGMRITRNEDGTIKVTGDQEHPVTRGLICKKGRKAVQRLFRKDRITTPLMRRGEEFVPVSWDVALNLIAKNIDLLRPAPESILHVRGYGHRGVLADAGKFFFRSIKASSTHGALCDSAGSEAFVQDFGALDQNDPQDITNAAYIVNWGKDLSRTSVHAARLVAEARKKGAKVITVSPGGDNHESYSDHHIRIRPGTDRFLAAAVTLRMILNGEMDSTALFNLSNWEGFKEILGYQRENHLLGYCEATEKDLQLLLDAYGNIEAKPVTTLIGWGLQRYMFGGQNVRYINVLAYLAGQVGQSGAGIYFGMGSSRNFNRQWTSELPKPSRTLLMPRLGQEILEATPPIKMLWVEGCNFVNQTPDASANIEAMKKIPFKVVVDAFMNDTSMRADIILPPALAHEREEIIGSSFHNIISYSAKVFEPAGEARSDFDIMQDLGSRLADPIEFPDKEEVLQSALNSEYLNTDLDTLRTLGWTRAIRPAVVWKDYKTAYADGKYNAPESLNHEPVPNPAYPLHMLTLIDGDNLHSQIGEEEQQGLPVCQVSLSNPLLGTLDLERPVYLATPLGRVQVKIDALPGLHKETVIVRRGGWMKTGHGVNHIIAPQTSDIGDCAAYYSQRARIEQDETTQEEPKETNT